MSNAEVAEMARQLGHTPLTLQPTLSGRRWVVTCGCGFGATRSNGHPSRTYATQVVALDTLRWHLRKAVQDHVKNARANGRVSALEKRQIG